MKVILPCGGYNTRLSQSITNGLPKHLLPVGKKTIIDFTMDAIRGLLELEECYIVTNDVFFKQFTSHFDGLHYRKWNFRNQIIIANDGSNSNESRLGTIGDVNFVITKWGLDDDVLIISPDNLYNFSLIDALEGFRTRRLPLVVSYDVKDRERAKNFGVLVCNSDGGIREFQEKPQEPLTTIISTGIYFFPRESLHRFKQYLEEGNNPDRMGDFIKWLNGLEQVITHLYGSEFMWFDIGTEQAYREAQGIWKNIT